VAFVQGVIDAEGGGERFEATFRAFHRRERFERWLPMRDFAAEAWKALGGD
jgi:hypothetical protein